jgi:Spy/CpxP family protein refolding chaperone
MRRMSSVVVVLVAALVSVAPLSAQPSGGRRQADGAGRRQPGADERPPQLGQLIPGPVQEQLKLTPEQKKQIEDLQKDVDTKIREARSRLDTILTAEQKKTLQEARDRGGRPRPPEGAAEGRPAPETRPSSPEAAPAGPGGRRPGFAGGTPRPGQLLPGFLQERLKLTDEQKKQVEELQKDVDTRLDKILTEDQKKELKEMRERAGRFGGRPGGDRPARPRQ